MREEELYRSVEPDTINILNRPMHCRLFLEIGGFKIEVVKGLVFPHDEFLIEDHPILPGYVAVRIDNMHENTTDMELEVQLDDWTRMLRDAQYRRA